MKYAIAIIALMLCATSASAQSSGPANAFWGGLGGGSAQIKDGLLRALAVTSTERIAILPDVPTMEEAGVPGQVQEAPQCVWAPAGTPREIVGLFTARSRVRLRRRISRRKWRQ